ncbi:hypothetical protein A0H81_03698 [Grifola frondosa]|uniref:Uncharacterized protein n=1 Tax=Grifola frondosa TaxID=5627 RepID=A0A1C7MIT7_GRIFR|nr:hypothetical protein A0H81_03698 [Grifola frondosa]
MTAELPPPGPDHFAARRTLWWARGPNEPTPTESTPSRQRLEILLQRDTDEAWDAGLNKVWNGLVSGARLKKRLPLSTVIKILQAGWIRDGTWPKGGVAPDPDDVLEELPQDAEFAVLSTTTPDYTSRVTSPPSGIVEGATGGNRTLQAQANTTTLDSMDGRHRGE